MMVLVMGRRINLNNAKGATLARAGVTKLERHGKLPDPIWERYKSLLVTLWLTYGFPMWYLVEYMRTNYHLDLRLVLTQREVRSDQARC